MRIVVNGRFSGRKTGVGRVIENLFKALQHIDRKNEYFIYVNKEFGNFIRFTNPRFRLISNGIAGSASIMNHIWTQTGFLWSIIRHRADVVVLPQINLFIVKLAPTIIFQHDLIEYHIPNQKWYKLLFRRMAFPLALRLSDRIVSVSENTRTDVKKIYGVADEKLSVIRNGVDLELFKPKDRVAARSYVRSKFGVEQEYLLYTGTLALPQKNLLRLVDAFDLLVKRGAQHRLVLAGGEGKDANLIRRRVLDRGLTERVVFTGYVDDEDLPYLYSAADVFCFPSLYEGFGLPVLEAMACGCPVVTSATSSLPEVAGDAALLVDPLSIDAIANAIERLISDNALQQKCREQGLRNAEQFSWKRAAEELLATINDVKQCGSKSLSRKR